MLEGVGDLGGVVGGSGLGGGVEEEDAPGAEGLALRLDVEGDALALAADPPLRREVHVPGLSTAGYCRPADVVGGDYYDYLTLMDGRQAVFMADVMDHGLHSAMLMAMLKSGLQIKIEHDASVNGVLRAAHRIADEQVGIFIYLTCCYLVFEPAAGYLEYANAGNPPMLLYRKPGQPGFPSSENR